MIKVEAIIRSHKLDELREELESLGITGMTVTEVRGYGRQKGHSEIYRGREYTVHFISKIKVELLAKAEQEEEIISAIRKSVATGQVGDGKIFIYNVKGAVRIRTGERDEDAL